MYVGKVSSNTAGNSAAAKSIPVMLFGHFNMKTKVKLILYEFDFVGVLLHVNHGALGPFALVRHLG